MSVMTLYKKDKGSCEATNIRALAEYLAVFRGFGSTEELQETKSTIKRLIEGGVDCKAKECDGKSPMDIFHSSGFKDLVEHCDNVKVTGSSAVEHDSL